MCLLKTEVTYRTDIIKKCRICVYKIYRRPVCKYFKRNKSNKPNMKSTFKAAAKFAVQLNQSTETNETNKEDFQQIKA